MSFNGIMPNNTGSVGSVMTFARHFPDDIKMKGIVTGTIVNKTAVTDGTNIYLSPTDTSEIIVINKHTEEVTKIPIKIGEETLKLNSKCMVCDERYLWIFANYKNSCVVMDLITKQFELVSTKTGDNGNSDMLSGGFVGLNACYDGERIWVLTTNSCLIKINSAGNRTMTGYSFKNSIGTITSANVAGGYLWIFSGRIIFLKVRLSDMQETLMSAENMSFCYTSAFDGSYLFAPVIGYKGLLRANPLTDEIDIITLAGDNMGSIPTATAEFYGSAFDGRYLWLAPYNAATDRLVRFDTETNVSKGYMLSDGYDMSTLPSSANKFSNALFDGQYLWLIPTNSDRVVKVYTDEISYKVTIKHQTENGMNVKTDRAVFIYEGDTFEETAPVITNFTCVGHKIDEETILTGKTATINDVKTEHNVIFIYRKNSELQAVNIIEKYQLQDGSILSRDTVKEAYAGLDYSSTAPDIKGYICVGYKIDNDPEQTGKIATIREVDSAHTIVFYYKVDDGSGNGNGNGGNGGNGNGGNGNGGNGGNGNGGNGNGGNGNGGNGNGGNGGNGNGGNGNGGNGGNGNGGNGGNGNGSNCKLYGFFCVPAVMSCNQDAMVSCKPLPSCTCKQ